jgi:putative tributyrin esterase
MLSRFAACLCVVALGSAVAAQEAPIRPRTIRTMRLTSAALNSVRTYGLLLPPDYDRSDRRYPVLYLLHGFGQQHATWGRRTLLDRTTAAIVVMPDMDRTRYVVGGGRIDPQVEVFITQELVSEIDARYRTLASRDGRAIAGLSIGGFGAMLLGLRHADQYSAIGAFSAPLDGFGDPVAALGATTVGSPRLYIGCGVADALLPSSRRFASLLEGAHIPRRYEEGPGAHNWEAWDWQLRSFLEMVK